MTFEELIAELRRLDGQDVAVAFHPDRDAWNPTLHVQGILHRDDIDGTPDWVTFVIGNVPYTDRPWRRARLKVFEHAFFELQRRNVEQAEWRRDLTATGSPVLAIGVRGGSMLTVAPP